MDPEMRNYTNKSTCCYGDFIVITAPRESLWKQVDDALIYTIVLILFFAVLGIGTNILNVIVFIKMGLQETTTISMLALALSDLICCILAFWTYLCYVPAFRDMPDLPFQSIEVSFETGTTFRPYVVRTGALITAFISLERCLCVVIPLQVKNIITLSATRMFMAAIYMITIVPYVVHPFLVKLDWKFYHRLNRTLVGGVYNDNPLAFFFMLINSYVCGFCYLLMASAVVFFCTVFLVITLVRSSRWREGMRTQTGAPTVGSVDLKVRGTKREDRLIKMVVVIAIVFIICTTPGTIVMFIIAVSKEYLETSPYHTPTLVLQANMIAFETVNNSINFFVYYMMGTRFKLVFRQLIGFKNSIVSS